MVNDSGHKKCRFSLQSERKTAFFMPDTEGAIFHKNLIINPLYLQS